jgi:hypothetical protein
MNKKVLLEKLTASKSEVLAAEERLVKLLRETRSGPRAEKTTVTELVSDAITRLRTARTDLDDLHTIVSEDAG